MQGEGEADVGIFASCFYFVMLSRVHLNHILIAPNKDGLVDIRKVNELTQKQESIVRHALTQIQINKLNVYKSCNDLRR